MPAVHELLSQVFDVISIPAYVIWWIERRGEEKTQSFHIASPIVALEQMNLILRNEFGGRHSKGSQLRERLNSKINLCITKYVSRFLKQLDPTRVVSLGVDHKIFKPTFEDRNYLLTITRIQPTKNPMHDVNAVKGTNYKLRIYGNMERYEAYERYYRELLSAKGKNVQISLNKSERTIIQRLQKCSLLLSPARNEGGPLVDLGDGSWKIRNRT